MRSQAIALSTIFALGCAGEITGPIGETFDDARAGSVVLEGEELENELVESPARAAPVPFARVGLIWDARRQANLELSTSPDGETWSAWRPADIVDVEVEGSADAHGDDALAAAAPETTSIVGVFEADHAEASYYRVRAAGGARPTFLSMEFLAHDFSKALEDGVAGGDGPIGSLTRGLSLEDADVNSRASWGARAPRCSTPTTPERVTIHHTVTPTNDSLSPEARLRQIQAYHMDVRGWCDIGYNYLVSRDGRVWEGRGATRLGTHTGGANTGNVGISFIGTYTSTSATDRQLDRSADLIRSLSDRFDIPLGASRIRGHRDFSQTACPGGSLYAQLGEIIDRARSSSGDPTPPPPPSGSTIKGIVYEGTDTSKRLSGAEVDIGSQTTTTNESGYYELRGVSSGTHEIAVSKDGFASRTITRSVSGSEVWGSVGLSPESAGDAVLVGVVYSGPDSADRIPGAEVTLEGGVTTTADDSGYYELEGLAPGEYEITASAPGYGTDSVRRTLSSGTTTWGSISL